MVVPYTNGLSESFEKNVTKWESKFILKKETPSNISLWSQGQGHNYTEKWSNIYVQL